jgi:glutathione S-transferase
VQLVGHLHRAVSGGDGLGQHLAAEYVLGLVILAAVEVPFDGLDVEELEDFLQDWVHAQWWPATRGGILPEGGQRTSTGGSDMTLKVYGEAQSRALRTLWMVEELGIDYEHVPTTFAAGAKEPAFLEINPNGRIPAIDDDGFRLWESMAINLYLAKKYGGELAPQTLEEDALATQWSFWVMTEVEKTLLQALFHTLGLFGVEKSPELAAACVAELEPALRVLDASLVGKDYLVGDRFTVADLNVASVLTWLNMARVQLDKHPNLQRWFQHCMGREALARASGIGSAS